MFFDNFILLHEEVLPYCFNLHFPITGKVVSKFLVSWTFSLSYLTFQSALTILTPATQVDIPAG